ncbi:hypothetical protein A1O1_04779 [Capronia coronata CBS 617.96]|uniref:Cutinase n=1 Tax=Capronia coronata CBS 617.96 TaxID=1182541 RepID=W9Y4Z1_9EURO|nr:uncharacterized protein A1O1_04779 [Capronia coronata CBS 617.96]EXJ87852.1 hypothetical protein A1O1_04779 [Capronia coronata CBS 617.96]
MLFTSSSRLALAGLALNCAVSTASEIDVLDKRQDSCKDVHIFLAKGNNEPYPGRQGKLAGAICYGLDSCDYEDIQYYNPVDSPYCDSVTQGVQDGVSQITAYASRCPNSKLVVSGYSQGAHVVGDVLGGGGGYFFNECTEPSVGGLDPTTSPGDKIVAVTLFGDVRHTAGQPYNVLSGADANGAAPRTDGQLTSLNRYSSLLRSYCVATDPVCAASYGSDNSSTHLTYFDIYTDDAASWIKEMINKAEESSSTTSSVAASTTSTAGTASTSSASAAVTTAVGWAPYGNSTGNSTTSHASMSTSVLATAVGTSGVATGTAGSETPSASPTGVAVLNGASRLQSVGGVVLSIMGFLAFSL